MKAWRMWSATMLATMIGTTHVYAQDELQVLQQKSQQSEASKAKLEQEQKKVKTELGDMEGQLNDLNKQISGTHLKIADVEKQVKETEEKILKKQNELIKMQADLEAKKEILGENLRLLYSKGDVSVWEVLFESRELSDFLYRVDILKRVADGNQKLTEEVKGLIEKNKQEKNKLEVVKKEQEQRIKSLEEMKITQIQNQQKAQMLYGELQKKNVEIKTSIHSEEQEMENIEQQIVMVVQKREEERKKREAIEQAQREAERAKKEAEQREKEKGKENGQGAKPSGSNNGSSNGSNSNNGSSSGGSGNSNSNNNSNSGGGEVESNSKLSIPLKAGSYRISSPYGYRSDPFTGERWFHNGMDYAAPVSTPIYAAADGEVLYSGKASGFGHWIVIAHNNGLYTIYGHMYGDQLYAKVGQKVKRGQHIAGVGSDGQSTGPHLHFSVANGFSGSKFSYVDPRNYY
ncbi:peptidoglycan DD-metalloendopeptidase family protein [Bacillus bombysepticus]|uniref:peptidoglycan DD-metalloendopeptidase family protein n=1 Tax=Bacillus bombysepticus TaxID=658666 RepID=UPI003015ACBE